MKLSRSIDRDAYKPIVCLEKTAPFIGQQSAIGLQSIINSATTSIFLLQGHSLLIERKRSKCRLTTMPSEEHFIHCLRFNVFFDEAFQ